MAYSAVLDELKTSGNNLTCGRVEQLLSSLNFEVKRTGRGNHHTVKHSGIPGFWGANYNCGHGRNPKPLPGYIRKLVKILEEYKDYLA